MTVQAAPATARPFDLVVWRAPHEVDDAQAADLVDAWLASGADPLANPFEASTDIGWFYRELRENDPDIDAVSDANPRRTKVPIWASGSDEAAARVVAIRLAGAPEARQAQIELLFSLAMKYDLVVFDANRRTVSRPLDQIGAYASASFWPRGALRAVSAGTIGLVVAIVGWVLGIRVVSGIAVIVGVLFFVLAAYTLAAATLARLGRKP